MYIMSWVGIATTISLVIDVPILLWSLADSLADVNLDHLPLGFHPSLLAALDDGVATESPSRLVDSYACDWWRHNTEPAAGQILGTNTLDECLNSYRQYIPAPSISHSSPIISQPQNAAADYRADCRSCNDLQALIQDMFDEARSMHALINGCESSADAAVNANVRKAAGFHQLHELTVLKELHAKPPALSSTTATAMATAAAMAAAMAMAMATATATATAPPPARAAGPSKQSAATRKSQLVAARAQAELERLKSLPPASHKWTWGVDITENDVLASNQKAKGKEKKAHHSGYARSLPDGVFRKGYSVTASIATAVSADFSRPPTVTGMDAGLYFSDTESVHSSCADDQSNAGSNAEPAPTPIPPTPTAFQAAMAWQGNDDDSSFQTGSPTSLNPSACDLPTASDAANIFLSLSDGSSTGSDADPDADATSDADADSDHSPDAESPTTSQIQNPTPSRITLPIYGHADFGYIDDTWLPGSDDMMDTDSE